MANGTDIVMDDEIIRQPTAANMIHFSLRANERSRRKSDRVGGLGEAASLLVAAEAKRFANEDNKATVVRWF